MIAAGYAIAGRVSPEELSRECIIPSTFDMGGGCSGRGREGPSVEH